MTARRGERVRRALGTLWSGRETTQPPPGPPLADAPRLLTPRAFRVLFVSDPRFLSHRYRAVHYAAALERAGITTRVVAPQVLARELPRVPLWDVVVIRRLLAGELLDELYRRCRRAGVPTVYDVDDLIFDPDTVTLATVDGLRFLSPPALAQYRRDVPGYRRALLDADACTTPTEFLAERCRALGKPTAVLPNGPGPELPPPPARPAEATVRLGYFSGSQTHQRDFATLVGPLARVLTAHPDVSLTFVGEIEFSEWPELLRFLPRVEHRPIVAGDRLAAEMARVDVNLAPLEIGNPYCEAKSPLKWIEAAAVGVPTVAAATGAFRAAIHHAETGFLASTPEDWEGALGALVVDAGLRARVGAAAHAELAARYDAGTLGRTARAAHATLVTGTRAGRGATSDVLALGVVIPPPARDGGHEGLVLALARTLAERGHEVRLVVHGSPDEVGRAKRTLWEGGHLGALRFAGPATDLAAADALVSTAPRTADVVRGARGLAACALHLAADGDETPGDARLDVVRVEGEPPAAAAMVEARVRAALGGADRG